MDKSVKVLKKVEFTFQDTFVDARGEKKMYLIKNNEMDEIWTSVKAGTPIIIDP